MLFSLEAKPVLQATLSKLGRGLICLLGLVSSTLLANLAQGADLELPKAMQGVGIDQNLGHSVPDHLVFTNAQGQSTSLSKLLKTGKPVLLSLNYSNCPGMCVAQLNGLVQGLNRMPSPQLGKDFLMVSISIDPAESSAKAKATHAKYSQDLFDQHDASGWEFWVGTSESIRQLTQAVGFHYTYDSKHNQFNHPSAAIFLSPKGKITRYVFEIGFVPETLKMAFVEAGQGTIGTPLDMIALWCVHYDPDENKYTANARKLMSLGGGLFVFLVLLVTVPYWFLRNTTAVSKDNLSQSSSVDSTENQS
jgi:protein SCO1/2